MKRPWISDGLGGLLLLAALSHSLIFYPCLVLPALLGLLVTDARVAAAIWAVGCVSFLRPLPGLEGGFQIDMQLAAAEASHYAANWGHWLYWLLPWPILLAATRCPRRFRGPFFAALLAVGFLASLWTFSPELLEKCVRVTPNNYGHDHFFYQEQWRQMKLGQGFYAAAVTASEADVRSFGATLRPPLWMTLWSCLVPSPPIYLLLAFSLASLGALWVAYRLAVQLQCRLPLLAPALLFTQYLYAGIGAEYLFVEFWTMPLAMAAACLLLRGLPAGGLALALLSALCREFFGLFFLAASLHVLKARRYGLVAAAWAVYLAFYAVHSHLAKWALGHGLFAPGGIAIFWNPSPANLVGCLRQGTLLLPFAAPVTMVLLLLGLRGCRGTPLAWWISGYWLVFMLFYHRALTLPDGSLAYTADYWGVMIWLWWLILACRGLGLSQKPKSV